MLLLFGCGDLTGERGRTQSGYAPVSASDVSASVFAQDEIALLRVAARDGDGGSGDDSDAGLDQDALGEPAPDEGAPATLDGGSVIEDTLGDDAVRCGDGVLDADELCDVSIEEGQAGACPNACPLAAIGCPELVLNVRTCWSSCVPAEPTDDPACAAF